MKDRSQFTPCFRTQVSIRYRRLTFDSCYRADPNDWMILAKSIANDTNVVYRVILAKDRVISLSGRVNGVFLVQCFPEQNGSDNCVKASFQISITVGSSLRRENHRGIMYLLSSITGSTSSPSRSSRRLLFCPAMGSLFSHSL